MAAPAPTLTIEERCQRLAFIGDVAAHAGKEAAQHVAQCVDIEPIEPLPDAPQPLGKFGGKIGILDVLSSQPCDHFKCMRRVRLRADIGGKQHVFLICVNRTNEWFQPDRGDDAFALIEALRQGVGDLLQQIAENKLLAMEPDKDFLPGADAK